MLVSRNAERAVIDEMLCHARAGRGQGMILWGEAGIGKGERKPSHPSAQAAAYFAQAVLSAMRLRPSRPGLGNVIALPDFPRYRTLAEETRISLIACGIDV